MKVVANAGPLIALARIGRIELLPALYGRVQIPHAVRDEVSIAGEGRPGARNVVAAEWVEVIEARDRMAVELLRERLGKGESEAIVLAIEGGADLLLIDEERGRRVSEARGLSKTGTIGALVLAKRRGLIREIAPVLEELRQGGFYLTDQLYHAACLAANERQ